MPNAVRRQPQPRQPAPQQEENFFSNWNWSNIAQMLAGAGLFLGGLAMYNRSNRTEVNNYYDNSRGSAWWGNSSHRYHDRF